MSVSNLLNISSSPHVRDKSSTKSIMWDVFLALMPAALFGIYNFSIKAKSINAVLLLVVCIATCVLTEYIWQTCMKLPLTVSDGSAALTGLLLALNLSSTFPVWMAILGSIFAILVVKQLFGGIGQNFMNPALGARCFLMVSFAGQMTSFTYDGVTGATPLAIIKTGKVPEGLAEPKLLDMFIGNIGGTIGETSAIALLLGAAYLLYKKIITWRIPVCYILTFAVFFLLFGTNMDGVSSMNITVLCKEIFGGGLMLGAFFMATDYVTSPITPNGQIVFGVVLGLLTGIFRVFGASAEGVSYAIIISNLLVPLIERWTIPTPFGKEGLKNE